MCAQRCAAWMTVASLITHCEGTRGMAAPRSSDLHARRKIPLLNYTLAFPPPRLGRNDRINPAKRAAPGRRPATPVRGSRFACDRRFFGNAENRPVSEPEGDHPHSLVSRPHNARQVSAVPSILRRRWLSLPCQLAYGSRRDWVRVANKTRKVVD